MCSPDGGSGESSECMETHSFGDADSALRSTLVFTSPRAWIRIALFDALGFGEAYMDGEIDVSGLEEFVEIIILNRPYLSSETNNSIKTLPFNLNHHLKNVFNSKRTNSLVNSMSNISAHYDLGNDMFQAFLDQTMMYSCPVWDLKQVSGTSNGLKSKESLYDAQLRKIHMIIEKAQLGPKDKVLEIGTGWGGFAIEAVKRTGCSIHTITLSKEQAILAQKRIDKEGLTDKIEVSILDYRLLPRKNQYTKVVSIEMLEAVGAEYLATYFQSLDGLLDLKIGRAVIQVITMPDERYRAYCSKIDFIQKYIFPGGHCPSIMALTESIYVGTSGKLIVEDLEDIGVHYARALRLWRESFNQKFNQVVELNGYDKSIYNNQFRRQWEFYFAYCEAGFALGVLGDVQVVLRRCGAAGLMGKVPR